MITVTVADDEEQICRYVRRILESEADIEVAGHALTGAEAVQLVRRTRPAVAILDVRMPGADGVEALAGIRSLEQPPAVLLLTNFNDAQVVQRAVQAGAAGVLLKSASPDDLIGAVRMLAAGHRVLGSGVALPPTAPAASTAPEPPPELPELTRRECDVLGLLALGLSNADIAARLSVSAATVKGHVSALMTKLDCRSRLQLGLLAHRAGLASAAPPPRTRGSL